MALFDYAKYNQSILGNESFIIYDANNKSNNPLAIESFKKQFHVRGYNDFSEVDNIIKKEKADFCYMIKSGERDGKFPKSCRVGIHVVFQYYQPHGDIYAYISEWLTNKMTGGKYPFVPHIIDMPISESRDLRKELNIPKSAIVFGRHGGESEFNLPFVHKAVECVARRYPKDVYFLFLNTDPFCPSLPNIIHLPATSSLQEKTDFILACDAMIHAREKGEIFSMSVGEFLFHDKPVISWVGGEDEGHHCMLKDKGLWYKDYDEAYRHMTNFDWFRARPMGVYKKLVKQYSPMKVMKKFDQVFLSPKKSFMAKIIEKVFKR